MTEQEYDILEHDWETMKAKYILGKSYKDIEEDFIAFCELGFYYALYLYAPLYRVGENKKVDAVIDAFPDMSNQEIDFAIKFLKGEPKSRANRARIKKSRKNKGPFKGLTKKEGFDLNIYTNALSEFMGANEISDNQFEQLLREYKSNRGDRADIRLLSGAVLRVYNGKPMDNRMRSIIESIANRPYSGYFESYRDSRKQSAEEAGE